jgi:Fic family protein
MFIEKRHRGRSLAYFLVHSYRVGNRVQRLSRYLGSNLSARALQRLRPHAERILREQMESVRISPYDTELGRMDIEQFRKFDRKLDVKHLERVDWKSFTTEFTYHTNAIEGSTIALKGVQALVEKKERPANHDETEAVNVAKAIAYVQATKEPFSVRLMLSLHRMCFRGTKHFAGSFRKVDVVIRDGSGRVVHEGAPHAKVTLLLRRLVAWYAAHKHKYPPLLVAAIVHNEFENIHPFQDGNGRVGRLLLNYVLLRQGYPPLNIRLRDRQAYYTVLQVYERTGNIRPTIRLFRKVYRTAGRKGIKRKGVYK